MCHVVGPVSFFFLLVQTPAAWNPSRFIRSEHVGSPFDGRHAPIPRFDPAILRPGSGAPSDSAERALTITRVRSRTPPTVGNEDRL